MTRAARSTRPFETLHEAVRSLEAAALVCFASPEKKPVHQLRIWTRRIEAVLEMIAALPEAPRIAKQRGKALRALRKLRRAAGSVRDLDVQRDLIAREAADAKGRSQAANALRKEAGKLRRDLGQQREAEAGALLALLKKERRKLPLVLKDLCNALAPLKDVSLTGRRLIVAVRGWYMRCTPQASGDETEALHAARKRAKLARYMLESRIAPSASAAHGNASRVQHFAAHLEALQHAGGQWHDLLQLHKTATRKMGAASPLSLHLAAKAARARRAFKRRLASPVFQ